MVVVVETITSSSSTLTDIKLGENCVEHVLRVMNVMGESVRKGGEKKRVGPHRQTDRQRKHVARDRRRKIECEGNSM